jgi:hypothetical protein
VEYGEREGLGIPKDAVKKGDRVLLIDDLVATGDPRKWQSSPSTISKQLKGFWDGCSLSFFFAFPPFPPHCLIG